MCEICGVILQRRKQDFERHLIFLDIRISAKLNKIELSEEFMALWREEQTLWYAMFPLYPDKNEKEKVCKECLIDLRFFQTDIFE